MLDLLVILSFGGIMLWQKSWSGINRAQVINNVIENVLLEDRVGTKEHITNDCRVYWSLRSDDKIIIFGVLPRFANAENVHVFLRTVGNQFCVKYNKQISVSRIFTNTFDFTEELECILSEWQYLSNNDKSLQITVNKKHLLKEEKRLQEYEREECEQYEQEEEEEECVEEREQWKKEELPYQSHNHEQKSVHESNQCSNANKITKNIHSEAAKTQNVIYTKSREIEETNNVKLYKTSITNSVNVLKHNNHDDHHQQQHNMKNNFEVEESLQKVNVVLESKTNGQVDDNVMITKDGRQLKVRARGKQSKPGNTNLKGKVGKDNNQANNNTSANKETIGKRKKPGRYESTETNSNNSNVDRYEELAKLSTKAPTALELRAHTEVQKSIYLKRLPNGIAAPIETNKWEVEKRGLLASWLRSHIGKREIDADDLSKVIPQLREKLITKNVAVEVTEHICKSVENSLKGTKLGTFDSLHRTVETSMINALERIMQPKHEINILRDVNTARSRGKPYSIVFCGVNGVGKSTSLAKIAYWLKENGYSVMLVAGDTFRHGAVEQLEVHGRCLECPVFQMGYGTDPSAVTSAALSHAARERIDVVMIDTAGRMQDHESRMRALAKLIHDNSPELVLFVGEALVGNNGIDQLRKFNRCLIDYAPVESTCHGIDGIVLTKFDTIDDKVGAALTMVYELGQPIVFVGVGQTYQDLKTMDPSVIVNALMTENQFIRHI